MYRAHNYETMTQEKRPQDHNLDGIGWTFETMEHGGEYPDTMLEYSANTDSDSHQSA